MHGRIWGYLQRCTGKVGRLSENIVCPFLLFFEHYDPKIKGIQLKWIDSAIYLVRRDRNEQAFSAKRCWP